MSCTFKCPECGFEITVSNNGDAHEWTCNGENEGYCGRSHERVEMEEKTRLLGWL